jgi:outer membrane cobalamin receptor
MSNKIIYFVTILSFLTINGLFSQSTISGIVTEKSGDPIIGANVFIEGSYDGTSTDVDGRFSFETSAEGEQILSISFLGYATKTITDQVSSLKNLQINLRASASTLDAVEITASTFKAGDNSKVAVLKPLDMVTTAGSNGDVIAAIQSLPGTQNNPEDGRLFVRGGDASETKIFIDGMRVFSPYSRTVGGTPSRGRYSPFLFKGVSFSTGGYDAEFGQALSGILDMSTIDDPNATETNISLMTVGVGVGHTHKGDNSSISFSGSYTDLTPYYLLAPTRLDFNKPYKGFSGEMVHRYKTDKGLFKNYIAADISTVNINNINLNTNANETIDLNNRDLYFNSTYSSLLSETTSYKAGISVGHNTDRFTIDNFQLKTYLRGIHTKAALKTIVSDFVTVDYGAEMFAQQDEWSFSMVDIDGEFVDTLTRVIPALFTSVDYFFNKDVAVKLGLRYEYNSIINTHDLSPRLTLAYKMSKHAQVSAAAGLYSQEVNPEFLFSNTMLTNEKATHYLINYNYKTDKNIIRLEGYYKNYDKLIRFDSGINNTRNNIANSGEGRAFGFDGFWRANNVIKYVDMWVSYSYVDSKRRYLDYPAIATPNFATKHNLSVVAKKWFPKLNSQLSLTYSIASGRPYDDPTTPEFMTERSGMYNNLSASWAYLITQQKILFISVSNVPRFQNEFGFRYSDQPNSMGVYNSQQIRPNDDQFFFVGFFITMSKDKAKNQLDKL